MYNDNVVSHLYQFLTKMCILMAALKYGIRKWKRNHGIAETEAETEMETEYGIRERRFQAIDMKKIYITNNDKIIKQIKKKTYSAVNE